MDSSDRSLSSDRGSLAGHEVKYISLLSITEIGVGSLLHAFKVPFGGHCLSLNQGFVLMQSVKKLTPQVAAFGDGRIQAARSTSNISLVTALLKSLSPAGKKLMPMLAIMVQGLLFSLGTILGGVGKFGMFLSLALLSLWAFAQPLLMSWLIVGTNFWEALELMWQKLAEPLGLENHSIFSILLGFVLFKLLLALILVMISDRIGLKYSEALAEKGKAALKSRVGLKSTQQNSNAGHPLLMTLRDLTSPLVIFSVLLSFIFAYFAKSSHSELVWALVRPVAAAFVGFYLIRIFPTEKMVNIFAKNNPKRAELLRSAKKTIESYTR